MKIANSGVFALMMEKKQFDNWIESLHFWYILWKAMTFDHVSACHTYTRRVRMHLLRTSQLFFSVVVWVKDLDHP